MVKSSINAILKKHYSPNYLLYAWYSISVNILWYILLYTLAHLHFNHVRIPVEDILLYMLVSVHRLLQKTKENAFCTEHQQVVQLFKNLKYDRIQISILACGIEGAARCSSYCYH